MKKRLAAVSGLFVIGILLLSGVFVVMEQPENTAESKSEQMLAVNELEQLALMGDMEQLHEKSEDLQKSLASTQTALYRNYRYLFLGIITALYIGIVFLYLWFSIFRPFEKMKGFAKEIAQGNLDIPLTYERSNYFGDFTWAFDSMRKEITRSRACEKEAVENNKTVIATLSHDIKTPISSLLVYAEGLEANMDSSAEKREKYISVIIKKSNEVAALTNDLFLHSLSSLDKLEISMETFELCELLQETVSELSVDDQEVVLSLPEEKIMVSADKRRLKQVCENIINNAGKYAKTKVDLAVAVQKNRVLLSFRDYGNGILDEDMPFVFGKFYRGKNCGNEQGSGLGLYIVKYIMEKMNGEVLLHNHDDGLEVLLFLDTVEIINPCKYTQSIHQNKASESGYKEICK